MDLQPTARGSHQALNDDSVLIALVLNKQGVVGVVDEFGEAVPPVGRTPDEVRMFAGVEGLLAPVGLETVDDRVMSKNLNQMDVGGPERGSCSETGFSSPAYPATQPPLAMTTRAGIGGSPFPTSGRAHRWS
jgi:hypothetical protein